MKKLLLTIILLQSILLVNAQIPVFQWAKGMGDVSNDEGKSIAVDSLGNVYSAGYFQGTVDFDPGVGTFTLASAGSEDIFISKLNSSGNFVWAKQIGGTATDYAYALTLDTSGNVYVTGYFKGTVDFDPGAGIYNLTAFGTGDIFVVKLDGSGNFVFARQMGGSAFCSARAIAVDASDNIYLTGVFQGTTDFDPGAGVFNLTTITNDIFVLKLDGLGNFVWAKNLGGSNTALGQSIAVSASGNVYTTGYFFGTGDFDPGIGVVNLVSSGTTDVFISKLNSLGNYVWAKRLGGANDDVGNGIALDASENVYTTGSFQTTADFDPGAATSNLISAGNMDIFISKLDASGNFVHAKKMGGTSDDAGLSVKLDVSGNIHSTGYFGSTADFDPGAAVYNLVSTGGADIFMSKLDGAGNFNWAQKISGNSGGFGNSIAVDAANNFYVSGNFFGTSDFDPSSAVFNLTSNGVGDAFVFKSAVCTIPTAPTNTTTVSMQTICANNSSTLSVIGSGTIKWYATPTSTLVLGTGSSYVTPILTAGSYTFYAEAITCTVSAGRTGIAVVVNPNPILNASSSSTLVCSGNTATLSASSAVSYSWNPGNLTGPTAAVSPTASTVYSVAGTDANGCIGTETVSVIVSPCTGVFEYSGSNIQTIVFPNPNNGIFSISNSEKGIFELVNSVGEIIYTFEMKEANEKINIRDLPRGIYYLIGRNSKTKLSIIN